MAKRLVSRSITKLAALRARSIYNAGRAEGAGRITFAKAKRQTRRLPTAELNRLADAARKEIAAKRAAKAPEKKNTGRNATK